MASIPSTNIGMGLLAGYVYGTNTPSDISLKDMSRAAYSIHNVPISLNASPDAISEFKTWPLTTSLPTIGFEKSVDAIEYGAGDFNELDHILRGGTYNGTTYAGNFGETNTIRVDYATVNFDILYTLCIYLSIKAGRNMTFVYNLYDLSSNTIRYTTTFSTADMTNYSHQSDNNGNIIGINYGYYLPIYLSFTNITGVVNFKYDLKIISHTLQDGSDVKVVYIDKFFPPTYSKFEFYLSTESRYSTNYTNCRLDVTSLIDGQFVYYPNRLSSTTSRIELRPGFV